MTLEERIQEAAENDDIVIGTEESLKEIDRIETVILAANAPAVLREQVVDAAEDADATVEETDIDNDELGSLCMKPFTASVVGLKGR